MTEAKKKNPQDATLRNARAAQRANQRTTVRVRRLEQALAALQARVRRLE